MSENQIIELFVQGEGIPDIRLIKVATASTVKGLIEQVRAESDVLKNSNEKIALFLEDSDKELKLDAALKDAGIHHRQRIHCHRCGKIEVKVNFNGVSKIEGFSPATTVAKVKAWADDLFGLKGKDATEHVLQLCGTNIRPNEDTHIGSLVRFPKCDLCFDLVPKKRVEG
jgi:hypothetical protein